MGKIKASDLPQPISDQDKLLHNIIDGTPNIEDLEPNSRQEIYLKYIALNGAGGGGGGGSSVNVVQERGESTTAVMSQNAVSNLTIFGPNASAYTDGVAIGNGAKSGGSSVTLGKEARAVNGGNIAIGSYSSTNNDYALSIGYNSKCNGGNSVSIGYNASITTDGMMGDSAGSVAIGSQSKTLGYQCLAVGTYAQALGGNSMALGNGAIARDIQGLAIGYNAQTDENATQAVAIGFSSLATESNTVSVGNETQKRRIVNVGTPVAASDAATKSYVDNAFAARSINTISTLSDETNNIKSNTPILLFMNEDGTQEDIVLSDNASNYEYMEVYYHNDLSQYNSVKIENPNNKYISLSIIGYNNNKILLQAAEIHITDDNISWVNTHIGEQSIAQGDITATPDNYIYIDKVVGYSK